MQKEIKHSWFFNHSPEKVWDHLTKSELLEQWLMKNDFQPRIGFDFQFITRPMPNFNFDGIIYCKVLEIVPFKKLTYSWKSGNGDGKIALDSIVEWTLQEKENGTELLLVHSGFKEADFNIHSIMSDGWNKNVLKIIAQLNLLTNDSTNP